MVVRERVDVTFHAVGTADEFGTDRTRGISNVFTSYTGVTDVQTTVTDSNSSGVTILVQLDPPQGSTGASITSTLNNGIMRSVSVLQSAMQGTGGTIVTSIGGVEITTRYEVVFPSPSEPPLSQTVIIIIVISGVVALIALIGVARYCDAGKLRATTNLTFGIARTATGTGVPSDVADAPVAPVAVASVAPMSKRSARVGVPDVPRPRAAGVLSEDSKRSARVGGDVAEQLERERISEQLAQEIWAQFGENP